MAEVYNHKVVEKKWQKVWDDEKALLQPMIIPNRNIMRWLNSHIHLDRDFTLVIRDHIQHWIL